eukprot:1554111-Rhodomonas_salina.2
MVLYYQEISVSSGRHVADTFHRTVRVLPVSGSVYRNGGRSGMMIPVAVSVQSRSEFEENQEMFRDADATFCIACQSHPKSPCAVRGERGSEPPWCRHSDSVCDPEYRAGPGRLLDRMCSLGRVEAPTDEACEVTVHVFSIRPEPSASTSAPKSRDVGHPLPATPPWHSESRCAAKSQRHCRARIDRVACSTLPADLPEHGR